MFNDRPLFPEYEIATELFTLPISLETYKATFVQIQREALTSFYDRLGITLLTLNAWQPSVGKEIENMDVLRERHYEVSVPVAFVPIPDIKNYITNMIVEDTPTSFGMLSENYGRDSTFSKHFKVIEHFEVLTTDPSA